MMNDVLGTATLTVWILCRRILARTLSRARAELTVSLIAAMGAGASAHPASTKYLDELTKPADASDLPDDSAALKAEVVRLRALLHALRAHVFVPAVQERACEAIAHHQTPQPTLFRHD